MAFLPSPVTVPNRSWGPNFGRPSRLQYSLAILAVTAIMLWGLASHSQKVPSYVDSIHRVYAGDITQAARNETLGFEKIFYISMPHRTDRQDQMSLMAARTDIQMELYHGVNGSLMSPKAQPFVPVTKGEDLLRPEQWGCWRSHADLWQRIVNEKITTALITEDDLDWDPNLKDIMVELGKNLRTTPLRPKGEEGRVLSKFEKNNAPYGLGWEVIHLGICLDGPNPPEVRKLSHAYTDLHAPSRLNMSSHFINQMQDRGFIPTNTSTTRLLVPAYHVSCTIAYAVTNVGAQKLLYNIGGVKSVHLPVDNMMAEKEKVNVMGYSTLPPVFTTWKVGGLKDSDIDGAKEMEWKKALIKIGSENLRESTRKKMELELGGDRRGTNGFWY